MEALVEELARMIQNHDADACDVVDKLGQFSGNPGFATQVSQLKTIVDSFEFEKAAPMLNCLLESLR